MPDAAPDRASQRILSLSGDGSASLISRADVVVINGHGTVVVTSRWFRIALVNGANILLPLCFFDRVDHVV